MIGWWRDYLKPGKVYRVTGFSGGSWMHPRRFRVVGFVLDGVAIEDIRRGNVPQFVPPYHMDRVVLTEEPAQ